MMHIKAFGSDQAPLSTDQTQFLSEIGAAHVERKVCATAVFVIDNDEGVVIDITFTPVSR